MIKDIQEEVYNILKSLFIESNIHSGSNPNIFKDSKEYLITFEEAKNEPRIFADGLEHVSEIYYDLSIYSKNPDTSVFRGIIDLNLNRDGFIRVASSRESYEKDTGYYRRLLVYKINI